MIYTKEWAFIHIPKTAGINLKVNLLKNNSEIISPFPFKDDMFKDLTQLWRNQQHNPYWWWQKQGVLTDQKAFSIVRNPYDRAASFYNFVTAMHPRVTVSFEDFYLDEWNSLIGWDFRLDSVHWNYKTTQLEFMKPLGGDKYPEVYKYETDLLKLQEYLKVDITSTRLNSQSLINFYEFYNADRSKIELVNTLFKDDFNAFDYKMETP